MSASIDMISYGNNDNNNHNNNSTTNRNTKENGTRPQEDEEQQHQKWRQKEQLIDVPPEYSKVRSRRHWFFLPHMITVLNEVTNDEVTWKSRKHRKGKPLSYRKSHHHYTLFKPWDISWWTAFLFLTGSIVWLANGIIAFHEPIKDDEAATYTEDWTAFVGGLLFFIGGWCMYWEALNMERTMDFASEIRHEEKSIARAVKQLLCRWKLLSHSKGKASVGDSTTTTVAHDDSGSTRKWRWLGWDGYRNISFMANFIQHMGTFVFFVSVIAALPNVLPDSETAYRTKYIWAYWMPQVLGAFFLTVSSFLLTLEAQKTILGIRPFTVSWNVGFWNILGSLGFFFSGLFGVICGPHEDFARKWGVFFTTYLGAYFFTIGSAFQFYEAIL